MKGELEKQWLTTKEVKQCYGISAKRLGKMRQERLVTYRPEGNKFLHSVKGLEAYVAQDLVEAQRPDSDTIAQNSLLKEVLRKEKSISFRNNEKKEEQAMMNWSKPNKAGRCRLNCGKGFAIIEDPLKNGKSYRLEYHDASGNRLWARMDKKRITDRDSAFEEHLKLRTEIAEKREVETDKESITFSQFAPIYLERLEGRKPKSYGNRKLIINSCLEEYFGSMKLSEIGFPHLENYVDDRKADGKKDGTIQQELSVLRHVFNIASLKGYFSKQNPVKIGELDLDANIRDRIFSDEEEAKFLNIIAEENDQLMMDVVMFDFHTAIRIENICSLKWEKMNLKDAEFSVPRQEYKNKSEYIGSLNKPALEILERLKGNNGHQDYVFVRYEDGKAYQLNQRWIGKKFKHYAEKAGIKDIRFHDIRRTIGRRFYSISGDLLATRDFLGHKSEQTTLRYLGMSIGQNKVKPAIEKLGKIWAENSPFWNGNGNENGVRVKNGVINHVEESAIEVASLS